MSLNEITDLDQLRKINSALLNRVESAMDQQGNAFSLFQTAINLEGQVKRRTDELTHTLRRLERTNAELAVAKEASDRANHSKTKFLAAASHDVLQPLNAALLSISVLADIQNSELGRDLTGQIERSLDTMSELLGILIDISKLDAGVAVPRVENFALSEVLDGVNSDFQPMAEEKNLKLKFLGSEGVHVRSDRTMLRRILQNLVSNAIRYTNKGGAIVAVRKRGGMARIEVIDTGFGIPENQSENVFEEFNRGALPSGHQREANNGLGLGLSIVRRMANALSHPLTMRSTVGRGTRFMLDVEIQHDGVSQEFPETAGNRQPHSIAEFSEKKVLLVENDPAGVNAMELLLDRWNCDTKVSSNVENTLSLLGDTDWIPDVIIADQHLDFGDLGTEAIMGVRAYVGRNVPALVITADPNKALDQKARQLGMELMLKPVKPARLRALLGHLLSGQAAD